MLWPFSVGWWGPPRPVEEHRRLVDCTSEYYLKDTERSVETILVDLRKEIRYASSIY
jgi:hypothetical protein